MDNNVVLEDVRDDKRIFERRNFSSLLRFNASERIKNAEGITRNISAGGAAFITKDRLRPREAVELWIAVPEVSNPIHKTAQVAWVKENLLHSFETGVKFDSVGLMELSSIFKNLAR